MAANPSVINNCYFKASASTPMVSPLVETILANVSLNFGSLTGLKVTNGSFTPANNYLEPFAGLTIDTTFNFLICLCDAQLNLFTVTTGSGVALVMPVKRFGFFSWVLDPANYLTTLYIDGRTQPNPGNTPMPQGQLVNYTFITGQANIS
jgi:hypothetical protein